MRFLMLMIPKVYQTPAALAAPTLPSADQIAAMMKYNEDLAAAGALMSLDGLHPPTSGARIRFDVNGARPGPAEAAPAGGVVGGYWVIRTTSLAEAETWARRCPAGEGDVVELRQIQEMADFPAETTAPVLDRVAALSERLDEPGARS